MLVKVLFAIAALAATASAAPRPAPMSPAQPALLKRQGGCSWVCEFDRTTCLIPGYTCCLNEAKTEVEFTCRPGTNCWRGKDGTPGCCEIGRNCDHGGGIVTSNIPGPTSEVPPTQAPTTQAPTDEPTSEVPPTEAPTTQPPTDAPTTQAPTDEPTTTQAPTDAPTTQAPTDAPTTTQAPTDAPTTSKSCKPKHKKTYRKRDF